MESFKHNNKAFEQLVGIKFNMHNPDLFWTHGSPAEGDQRIEEITVSLFVDGMVICIREH